MRDGVNCRTTSAAIALPASFNEPSMSLPPKKRILAVAVNPFTRKGLRRLPAFAVPRPKALSRNQPIQKTARVCNIVGGALSPLLSNLLLDDLDRELERRGLRFVRYADDCNIYVRSRRAGERVMQSVSRFITGKLKLKVNESKSAVARPAERKFLGFSFTSGREPKRRIAPQTLLRFKKRIRELTKRNRGVSVARMVEQLRLYLTGWRGYFGFCQTPSVLEGLDSWIRRRLRCFQWKQRRRGKTRFAELRKRGVGQDLAAQTAGSSRGLWHISRSPALSIALPGAYFTSLGLPTLSEIRNV